MTLKNTFKALADPVRRDILLTLRNQSLTVGEIVDKYNLRICASKKSTSLRVFRIKDFFINKFISHKKDRLFNPSFYI